MSTETVSPLRERMIEDMNARKLCVGTQRGHIRSCKQFATFLKRSPAAATAEDIRRFQMHLSETGTSICNRNRIMTGLRFLFRVTLSPPIPSIWAPGSASSPCSIPGARP
jgi:integrase/recombinase XerD